MIRLAITGSLGMGKSTVAAQLAFFGARVHDADATVHRLLSGGGAAVAAVQKRFPACVKNGAVDRARLGREVFADPQQLKALESILHPLVQQEERRVMRRCARMGVRWAVADIPLLFETRGQGRFDAVITVTAPFFIQRRRILARPGMTEEKMRAILARQMPDAQKRRRADFVVHTGLGKAYSFRQVKRIIRELGG